MKKALVYSFCSLYIAAFIFVQFVSIDYLIHSLKTNSFSYDIAFLPIVAVITYSIVLVPLFIINLKSPVLSKKTITSLIFVLCLALFSILCIGFIIVYLICFYISAFISIVSIIFIVSDFLKSLKNSA